MLGIYLFKLIPDLFISLYKLQFESLMIRLPEASQIFQGHSPEEEWNFQDPLVVQISGA